MVLEKGERGRYGTHLKTQEGTGDWLEMLTKDGFRLNDSEMLSSVTKQKEGKFGVGLIGVKCGGF